ncbi:HNH endonuclease [Massilia pinisoli]|uniref:HNH endonuclease n=1 Tax=Massilia pinisoli TaxID=1772194 RepID=A0ABT2A035_9BURK|nr:RHS repeat-associated core domain-containing protein [Massilia pinisoli]MCS0585532.1 HNH endonuclease [Massilia pinisoli]
MSNKTARPSTLVGGVLPGLVALLGLISVSANAQTAQSATSRYAYDGNGNLIQATDPLNRVSDFGYDEFNRIKQVTLPAPTSTTSRPIVKYAYDGQDNPATVSDPRGLTTTYVFNGVGEQRQLTSPDTNVSAMTYDASGNVKTVTDARQQVKTYKYDSLNRVTNISFTSGTGTTFEYDGGATPVPAAIGHLTKMTDESGQTTYVYNAFGELVSRTQTVVSSGVSRNLTVSYAVGTTGISNGKLSSITYPSGNRLNYTYDAAGRLSGITLNPTNNNGVGTNTTTSTILLSGITYAAFGPVKSWNWGNSTGTNPNGYTRTFDLDGRVTSYSLGNALTTGTVRTVRYDAAGRILAYEHTATNQSTNAAALNQSFGYDNLDRLTAFSAFASTQAYDYDANGNRTKLSIGTATYTNAYLATSNRLMSTTGPTPAKTNQYDNAGNLSTDGTVSYTYSSRGRMSSATVGANTVKYLYNGLGQRVLRSGGALPNASSVFFYDEQGKLIGEYDLTTGKMLQEFVYLADMPVTVLQQSRTGTVPNEVVATNAFYVYADHIRTPRLITRASDNKIVWRWDNGDAFALVPPNEDPSGLGRFTFNLRMPGQYFDRDTNLFYNYFRDYDPQLGRYVQSDPIGLGGGLNTYSYVGGNPLQFADPSGRCIEDLCIGEAIVAGRIIYQGYRAYRAFQAAAKIAEAIKAANAANADGDAQACPSDNKSGTDKDKKASRRPSKGTRDAADLAATDSNGNLICTYCGVEMTTEAGHENSREHDHIDPWVDTHDSSPANITDACRTCNRGKGRDSVEDFLGL